MSYTSIAVDEVESVIPEERGSLRFLRDPLDCENLGISAMELEPGAAGKEHDHADDGQEEVYLVVEGELDVDLDGETVTLGRDEALRVAPDQTRQLHNRSDAPVRLVVVGAP